jgi:hypothetical protein
MPARAYSFARSVLEQAHGPEALTVERPAETRQEEIRALLGGPPLSGGPVAQPCRRRRRAVVGVGSAASLQGEGCGFESRTVHPADVAQLGEARRSDRRQCRFESDRQYHLDVAQRERTGFGSRGLEVRALPSRRNARWWNWHHAWP